MRVLALASPCHTQWQHQTCLLLGQAGKLTVSPSDLMLRSRVLELR